MKKDVNNIYTIDLNEYHYSKVKWQHPIISILVAIVFVGATSLVV